MAEDQLEQETPGWLIGLDEMKQHKRKEPAPATQ